MANYATNAQIGYRFFRNQTFPSDNTVDTSTNTSWCTDIMSKIKEALGYAEADTEPTDSYGSYRRAFLWLYGRLLDNLPIEFMAGSMEEKTFLSILKGHGGKKTFVTSDIYTTAYGNREGGGPIIDT